jgi:ubiquinone/menaquinone biosynthesis C-methylase UbiE
MDKKQHWEQVYTTKATDNVSWFQEHANQSLELIHNTELGKDAVIIDVGGGASTLVDDLAEEGYTNLTVLDLSSAALEVAKHRLGKHAEAVRWIVGDITKTELPENRFDVWHDRAVFHFLTDPSDRQGYVEQVMRSVRPGGHVIIAAFAEDGPEKCSGLPVMRYKPEALHAEFGDDFLLIKHEKEAHHTPFGLEQQFIYCYCRKRND